MAVSYSFSPELPPTIAALILGFVYLRRWRAVRSESPKDASLLRATSFISGLLTLVIAQGNPVDELGDHLLSMHMVQHVLLLDLMPVLLLLGLNRVIMRPITRRVQVIERKLGFISNPWFAVFAYCAGMWVWHIPALYNAAAEHEIVHLLEHMTFTGVGFLYWWHLLSPIPSRHKLTALQPVAYMVSTKVILGMLGIALTFTQKPLYAFYERQNSFWGLNALDDQALAGAIMGTEQSMIMGVALFLIFVRTLNEAERKTKRQERLQGRDRSL